MAKKGSGRRVSVQIEMEPATKSYEELKKDCASLDEIRNVVRTLPLDNVLPLLQELLNKFDVQQARDTVLTEWIKTILLIHTAYFMKQPEVVQQLSSLYQDLDDRLTVYPKLLAMHGRLELVQSQIDSRNRKDTEQDDIESENEQVDTEDEEEEEDDEDNVEEDDEDDLMEMDSNEEFKEEEQVSDSEDEDDNISDSDLEA